MTSLNCMAGRGVKTRDECLTCALQRDNECGYDYALLRKMLNRDEEESRQNEIHVTDLTGCLRRSYYTKRFPMPEFPHETLARFLGVGFHKIVEGSDDVMESELPLKYGDLVGTADVVYKNGTVVDFKFSRWLKIDYLPNSSHIMQVNIYAHMLRGMGREVKELYIQYVDASGPSKCRKCRIPARNINGEIRCPSCMEFIKGGHLGTYLARVDLLPPSVVEEYISTRLESLSNSMALQALPEAETSFLCAYCNYQNECQEDLNEI